MSGRAAAAALRPRAASVVTLDDGAADADLHDAADVDLTATDLVVVSPGWRPSHPLLVAAAERGVPVWSEVELAWRLRVAGPSGRPAPWLAVTGTNGKTTTVEMLETILRTAGLRTAAVGNVGTPVVEAVLDPTLEVLAVELELPAPLHAHDVPEAGRSSTSPRTTSTGTAGSTPTRPTRAVSSRTPGSRASTTSRTPHRGARARGGRRRGARAVGFTLGAPARGQLGVIEDVLVDRAFHAPADAPDRHTHAAELATLGDLSHLAGADGVVPAHVVANALAAAALARAHGVPAVAVRDGLRAFRTGSHRIEQVASVDGVAYVDDSKATNAHAASASLAAFAPGTVVWVAGASRRGRRSTSSSPRAPTGCAPSCSSASTRSRSPVRSPDTRPISPSCAWILATLGP